VLGFVALYLLIAGLKIHHDYAVLTSCHPANSGVCGTLAASFAHTDWTIANTTLILMNFAPVLLGMFAGAPMLARELETGTFRYAWTQGFARERSVIARLVLVGLVVAALAGAFGELFAWFFQPAMRNSGTNVLAGSVFATRGVAFAAWTLAAFMIAACAGMLLRRTVPAMAVTIGVYSVLDLLTWLVLRARYLPSVVTGNPNIGSGTSSVNAPWVVNSWATGPGGKPVSQAAIRAILQRIPDSPAQGSGIHQGLSPAQVQYLTTHDYVLWTRYIPVSRFWPMQFVEGGWLLALSVAVVASTVWLVRRRAA
jgi:hypothetical protein